jgi:hypothetical protein
MSYVINQKISAEQLLVETGNQKNTRKVYRQEHKFGINLIEYSQASTRVSKVLRADDHNGGDGYNVRSLYFDTVQDSDFWAKVDGYDVRKKIRLRIYDTQSDYAKLEMKQKQSIYQLKRSMRLHREDAIEMSKGRYEVLLKYDEAFAKECYALMMTRGYVPKSIVEYRRKAFVANGNDTRITFDSKIIATEFKLDLFSENISQYPVIDDGQVILEVKYNGFLYSYIKELLTGIDKIPLSASKYCLSRSMTISE